MRVGVRTSSTFWNGFSLTGVSPQLLPEHDTSQRQFSPIAILGYLDGETRTSSSALCRRRSFFQSSALGIVICNDFKQCSA